VAPFPFKESTRGLLLVYPPAFISTKNIQAYYTRILSILYPQVVISQKKLSVNTIDIFLLYSYFYFTNQRP
jgi:hypothetical protein